MRLSISRIFSSKPLIICKVDRCIEAVDRYRDDLALLYPSDEMLANKFFFSFFFSFDSAVVNSLFVRLSSVYGETAEFAAAIRIRIRR